MISSYVYKKVLHILSFQILRPMILNFNHNILVKYNFTILHFILFLNYSGQFNITYRI